MKDSITYAGTDVGAHEFLPRRFVGPRLLMKCGSHGCSFLVHTDPSFGDFCCIMCEQDYGCRHGKKCERRAYRETAHSGPPWTSQASEVPRRMPRSEADAFLSGAVAVHDWHDDSEPESLAVKRGERFRKAVPWDLDDGWQYAWRPEGSGKGQPRGHFYLLPFKT